MEAKRDKKNPDIQAFILQSLDQALQTLGILPGSSSLDQKVVLERPADFSHGDYSTNVALIYSRNSKVVEMKLNPRALADKICEAVKKELSTDAQGGSIEKIEIAGPGFINFTLTKDFYIKEINDLASRDLNVVINSPKYSGQKVLVEYTDPNAFKVFHIGHLMSNAIGESWSRLLIASGAEVVRICYPSDIGLHIAKAVWAMREHSKDVPADLAAIAERTDFLGKMYVLGTEVYEKDKAVADAIDEINKKLFTKSDSSLNEIYEKGRRWSLEHFDLIYKKLGTKFDHTIFESEVSQSGLNIVTKLAESGKVFEKSDGAIVFKGEPFGLHTRVFVNSHGLPTYESKEIGLNTRKFELVPEPIESIIVTASEQNDYFKVVIKALTLIDQRIGEHTKHIGHGMLRLATGKMSSRTGSVITGESLIDDIEVMVLEKMHEREFSTDEKQKVAEIVAVGAIKYSILKQAFGGDISYDPKQSISFEGDSGPYLQYSCVRAKAVLSKAGVIKISKDAKSNDASIQLIERLLVRFPEAVIRCLQDISVHHISVYLIELAGAFNTFYANNRIMDAGEETQYRLAITTAFAKVMERGLHILGIKVPERM